MCVADLGRAGFTHFLRVPVVQAFHSSPLVRKHPRPARYGVFAVSVDATGGAVQQADMPDGVSHMIHSRGLVSGEMRAD